MSTATVCKRQTGPNTAEIERETVRRQILRDLADGRFFVFLFRKIRGIMEEPGAPDPVRESAPEPLRARQHTKGEESV